MKKQSGFTLIELLLVLAIIGIIAAIAIPAILGQREAAKNKATVSNAQNVRGEIANAIETLALPDAQRPTDLQGKTKVGDVLTALAAREQFVAAKNPFNGNALAYRFGGATNVIGEVGIEAQNNGGTGFPEVVMSYSISVKGVKTDVLKGTSEIRVDATGAPGGL